MITSHHFRYFARAFILRLDQPSLPGCNTQHVEELSAHFKRAYTLCVAQLAYPHFIHPPRKYPGEGIVMAANLLPHGNGELRKEIIRDAKALVAADDAQLRQLLRLLDGQTAQ